MRTFFLLAAAVIVAGSIANARLSDQRAPMPDKAPPPFCYPECSAKDRAAIMILTQAQIGTLLPDPTRAALRRWIEGLPEGEDKDRFIWMLDQQERADAARKRRDDETAAALRAMPRPICAAQWSADSSGFDVACHTSQPQ